MRCHVIRLQSSRQMAVPASFWDILQVIVTNGMADGIKCIIVTNGLAVSSTCSNFAR